MLDEVVRFLKDTDVEYSEHASLAELSNIRAGGTAAVIASPKNVSELVQLLDFLTDRSVAYKVVGRMTNTMSWDREFKGVIIKTSKLSAKNRAENIYTVECGARLSHVIWDAAKFNLGGLEALFMIPASVGGAVFNNAGAHGKTISDFVVSGKAYSLREKLVVTLEKSDMNFGYRKSVLTSGDYILLSLDLAFDESSFETVKEKISEYASIRRSSQPLEYPSLGSVYKRHRDVGAGYYIEKAGLKGYRIGDAMISAKHAGFIVNVGKASVSDIAQLIEYTKNKVYSEFGIMLEEEIEII